MKRWVPRVIVIAAGLVIGLTGQAQAVAIGDQFTVTFTETVPTPGLVATADITLGSGAGSLFSITDFTAISGGVCLTCGLTSENLTKVSFDGATLGLNGYITGTFLGGGGGSHSFALALTDGAVPSWIFADVRMEDNRLETARGTYTTAASVPEPSTMLLLGSALTALAAWRRRIKA